MPSIKSPSVVLPGVGRLSVGQVPASALSFSVSEGDLVSKELATPTRSSLVTPGSPVASVTVPLGTFLGDATGYPLDMLYRIVDSSDRAIYNGASRVQVTSISGATIGDDFSTSTFNLNLTPSIPSGQQYRVYYHTKTTMGALPIDSLTFNRVFGLYADGVAANITSLWKDGTGVTSSTANSAIAEIVSDLASVTSVSNNGGRRVGTVITNVWKDATGISSTSVSEALSEIVSDLASFTSVSDNGGLRIGTVITNVWKDATGISSTSVSDALSEIVSDLASASSVSVNGGLRIGTVITNLWNNGFGIAATSVSAALSEIVSDLSVTSGGALIGVSIPSTWNDGSTISSTSVSGAINEIVLDLRSNSGGNDGARRIGFSTISVWADNTFPSFTNVGDVLGTEVIGLLGGTNGSKKIGADVATWSGPLSAVGGGGFLSTDNSIQEVLITANTRLVARRAFTAVVTDGTNSVGGDLATLDGVFANGSGTYFVRRGDQYYITQSYSSGVFSFIGEQNGTTSWVKFVNARVSPFIEITLPATTNDTAYHSFENIRFEVSTATNYWNFTNCNVRMTNCSFTPGTVYFYHTNANDTHISIDGLVVNTDQGTDSTIAVTFDGVGSTAGYYGTIRNLSIKEVNTSFNMNSLIGLYLANLSTTTSGQLVFDNLQVVPTGFGASGGYLLYVDTVSQKVVFRGSLFKTVAGSSSFVEPLHIGASSNLSFEDCQFIRISGGGAVARLNTVTNTVLKGCQFTNGGGSGTVLDLTLVTGGVVFEDCTFTQNGTGTVLATDESSYGVKFVRCLFQTSPTTANIGDVQVVSSLETDPIQFIDCKVEIRFAESPATLATPANNKKRLLFGENSAGTRKGLSGPMISGMDIYLTGSSTAIDRFFFIYEGGFDSPGAGRNTTATNLRFHLNSKQIIGLSGQPMIYFGENTTVRNLVVNNLRGPSSGSGLSDAIMLQGANVEGGSVESSQGDTEVFWRSVFSMIEDLSGVNGVRFWFGTSKPTLGRHFYVTGDNCYVRNCKFKINTPYRSVPLHTGTTGSSTGSTTFTDASASFNSYGLLSGPSPNDWLIIDSGQSSVGFYNISSHTNTTLTLTAPVLSDSTISYSIYRTVELSDGYLAKINMANGFDMSGNDFVVTTNVSGITGASKAWVVVVGQAETTLVVQKGSGTRLVNNWISTLQDIDNTYLSAAPIVGLVAPADGNVQVFSADTNCRDTTVTSNYFTISHPTTVTILNTQGNFDIVAYNHFQNVDNVSTITVAGGSSLYSGLNVIT